MSAPARTVVKVCGLTRAEDVRVAVEAGADWLGFVLWEPSPRRVAAEAVPERVAEAGAAGSVQVVAVMVDVTPERALELAARAGAHRVQLHRVRPDLWPSGFPLPAAFAVPVDAEGRLLAPPPAEHHLLMLDAADRERVGGTGIVLPWERLAEHCARRPVLLAGGLSPDNVAEAVARARPFGVDAASGLEFSPGLKDPDRVRRFVAAVRAADARHRAA